MSDQGETNDGKMVPSGQRDLTPVAAGNPLVSRGIAELAKLQDLPDASALLDVRQTADYQRAVRSAKLMMRLKALHGLPRGLKGGPPHSPGQPAPEPMTGQHPEERETLPSQLEQPDTEQ